MEHPSAIHEVEFECFTKNKTNIVQSRSVDEWEREVTSLNLYCHKFLAVLTLRKEFLQFQMGSKFIFLSFSECRWPLNGSQLRRMSHTDLSDGEYIQLPFDFGTCSFLQHIWIVHISIVFIQHFFSFHCRSHSYILAVHSLCLTFSRQLLIAAVSISNAMGWKVCIYYTMHINLSRIL